MRDYLLILTPYALAHATYNLVLRVTFTFTPSFLVEFKGIAVASAGLISMALPFAGIFAKIGSGFILLRVGPKYSICGATALSAVFLASLVWYHSKSLLVFNLLLLGLTLYSFSPIIYSSTLGSLPSGSKSSGLGLVTMFGNLIGAISTFMVGSLIDNKGYASAFNFISIITLFASFIIFLSMSKKNI